METLIKIEQFTVPSFAQEPRSKYYFIVLLEGDTSFSVDFTEYCCRGKNLLFIAPYQMLCWQHSEAPVIDLLKFHGDFYCIEYHKAEVACNGILFNNIYDQPFVAVSDLVYAEVSLAFKKIAVLEGSAKSYDQSLVKSYLQLILALGSKEKQVDVSYNPAVSTGVKDIAGFPALLDSHFIETKSVSFYAGHYALSVDAFSKKIKKHFGKTPSKLIRERMILEAKKLLHLTYRSIKEIASELGFDDEFYFSRYFKSETGVAPKAFRESVGISIAAK